LNFNRRQFVKYVAIGGGLGLLGGGARIYSWFDNERAPNYKILSADEVEIVNSIADAMFPGDDWDNPLPKGSQVGVVELFDDYLAAIDRPTANLLRVLLHAIDDFPLSTFARFRTRPLNERIEILDAWDQSSIPERRGSFRSIKLLFSTAYCEHPKVLSAMGIRFGCGA